jgi:hypothetical protein
MKKTIRVYVQVLFQHSSENTEENIERNRSGEPVKCQSVEQGALPIKVYNVTSTPNFLVGRK